MITQRIALSINQRDWVSILIEFFLVIIGILIALQLDQWNDRRKDHLHEHELLETVRDDIRLDIINIENAAASYLKVVASGATALAAIDRNECVDDCWSTLVAFFLASQWVDVALNRSTYDEMRLAGLPRDPALAAHLSRYQLVSEQGTKLNSVLPAYREQVRSLISLELQQYMWANCFRIEARLQFLLEDCAAPPAFEVPQSTLIKLFHNPELELALTYWLSTVTLVSSTFAIQNTAALTAIAALDAYLLDD